MRREDVAMLQSKATHKKNEDRPRRSVLIATSVNAIRSVVIALTIARSRRHVAIGHPLVGEVQSGTD